MAKLGFMWLDLNLLEIFVQIFLPGLKKSQYFSFAKLYPHFNPKMPKSSSSMFNLYFSPTFKYFSL